MGMVRRGSAWLSVLSTATAVVTGAVLARPVPAGAGPGVPIDGMPTQAQTDLAASDPGNSRNQAGWADLPGGVSQRPYVRSLSLVNGATVTPVITAGDTTPAPLASGDIGVVVSPVNLCRSGQTPQPGVCYVPPNRVALNLVYGVHDSDGTDFANPQVPLNQTVNADTVIDMTVALNTMGQSLRWTWVNGDLLYWQPTNLGQPDATVRIKFRPAYQPYVSYARWPSGNGCTATPIFNCNLPQADAETLNASILFSLDDTLDSALTGAVFATQEAVSGYLQPGGSPSAPTLDIQAASAHYRPNGAVQYGTLQAFLPAGALVNLYGVLPADAGSFFSTTRAGDHGSNDPPAYAPWSAPVNGADGLLVTVRHITFSVPRYHLTGRLTATTTQATVRGSTTTVTATVPACTRSATCTAQVYRLGAGSARYLATRTLLLTRTVTAKSLSLPVASGSLHRGDRYLLVVRATRGGKPVASTTGTAH